MLIGMVPVTIDVTVRVVGQALVITFAPIVGAIGMVVKLAAVILATKKMKIVLKGTLFMNWFGGISSPAIVYGKLVSASKDTLRKYYAINRITVSTIVLAELAITFALITTVPPDRSRESFIIRFPAEVREDLNCSNICEESLDKEEACRDYVPMPSKDFHILTITLMFLAAYTIIESIAMLIGIHATPSDWLLFDQKDRPDQVL